MDTQIPGWYQFIDPSRGDVAVASPKSKTQTPRVKHSLYTEYQGETVPRTEPPPLAVPSTKLILVAVGAIVAAAVAPFLLILSGLAFLIRPGWKIPWGLAIVGLAIIFLGVLVLPISLGISCLLAAMTMWSVLALLSLPARAWILR